MSTGKNICTLCNYIYDEALGDPSRDIPKSVPFEALDDKWLCPDCGADKTMFQPCSCVKLPADISIADLKNTTVGQLVAQHPVYAKVFESLGIDYCCGGKRDIVEVCSEKSIELETLVQAIAALDNTQQASGEPNWNQTTLKELIDHIISVYHLPLRQELPRIEQMANKVAAVHGKRHPEMIQLASIFTNFRQQLELHMQKEEIILFPAIVRSESGQGQPVFGCGGGIENPINVMFQEHDDAGDALKKMRSLTDDYTAPDDACNTFRVLLDALQRIESEMHLHVHKENHILFPRALAMPKPELTAC